MKTSDKHMKKCYSYWGQCPITEAHSKPIKSRICIDEKLCYNEWINNGGTMVLDKQAKADLWKWWN